MTQDHDLLLFDMDGTLSDPLVGMGRSLNHALNHFGLAPLELSAVSAYVGIPLDETFQALTGITDRIRLNALVAKYRECYAEVGYAENVLYPGIPEALTRLATADVALAVCTSKRKYFAERILEKFGIRSYFRFVSGGDTGVRKWQQVEGLLAKGMISESSIMVGDRAVDLIAAHRNRLSAAGVLWGYGSREELERESPCYWLGTPSEIPLLAEGVSHHTLWRPVGKVIREDNELLRGWAGYFHFRNSTWVLAQMRRHSQNRLRRWRKQGCKHGRWKHYSDERLRDHYGLCELPITAAWKAN